MRLHHAYISPGHCCHSCPVCMQNSYQSPPSWTAIKHNQISCCPCQSVFLHWLLVNILFSWVRQVTALEPFTGPPGSAAGPADTHQKFMAALAKAALAQVHSCTCLHTHCHTLQFAPTSKTICRLQKVPGTNSMHSTSRLCSATAGLLLGSGGVVFWFVNHVFAVGIPTMVLVTSSGFDLVWRNACDCYDVSIISKGMWCFDHVQHHLCLAL